MADIQDKKALAGLGQGGDACIGGTNFRGIVLSCSRRQRMLHLHLLLVQTTGALQGVIEQGWSGCCG